jgi:hypothetical protein
VTAIIAFGWGKPSVARTRSAKAASIRACWQFGFALYPDRLGWTFGFRAENAVRVRFKKLGSILLHSGTGTSHLEDFRTNMHTPFMEHA